MFRIKSASLFTPILFSMLLALSSCSALQKPDIASGAVPTPLPSEAPGPVDVIDSFVDPAYFLPALIQALDSHDIANLQKWMTDSFLVSTWRDKQVYVSPAEALDKLFSDQLGAERHLEQVKDVDLKALMGGTDPVTIPGDESGVMYAYLVSGWGVDGQDEAILFITKDPADNLKWEGWMQIKGGFSGTRLGGIQPHENTALGISLYVPKVDEVSNQTANSVLILGPGAGHPSESRAGGFINVETANGRTAEQVATKLAEENKALLGAGYTGANITVLDIEGEPAYSVDRLTGQDFNRQVFIVHNQQLYTFYFIPDNPKSAAYGQMEDMYYMVVNTLHFTK